MMQFMFDEIQILCLGFASTLEGEAFENTFHKNEETDIYRFSVEWTDLPSFRETALLQFCRNFASFMTLE